MFRRDRQRLRSVRTTQSGIPHKASKTRRAEHRSLRSSETQEQESRVLRQSSVASKVVAEERKTVWDPSNSEPRFTSRSGLTERETATKCGVPIAAVKR